MATPAATAACALSISRRRSVGSFSAFLLDLALPARAPAPRRFAAARDEVLLDVGVVEELLDVGLDGFECVAAIVLLVVGHMSRKQGDVSGLPSEPRGKRDRSDARAPDFVRLRAVRMAGNVADMEAAAPGPESEGRRAAAELRADAQASRERILRAAATLIEDRRTSMAQIAAAADVSRSTLYRHFATRQDLAAELERRRPPVRPREPSSQVTPLPYRARACSGRNRPMALEVTHILDEVPPHLIADQLVAEARRAAGVPVALYVVDIDGSG